MNNPDHNDDKLARYVTDHIESALAHNEIKVVYEPQVRTASSEVCGFEALARWEDHTYGQLSPKDFVAALEEADKIHILDRGMIRLVCEEYRVRADRGEEMVPISFNLSWKDFILSDMFTWIEQERSRCGVPTSMLRVEITESTIHYDRTAMNEVVDRFAMPVITCGWMISDPDIPLSMCSRICALSLLRSTWTFCAIWGPAPW